MTKYLISFPSEAMNVTAEELPAVGDAARAVIIEAQDAGVYVFGGGINEGVPPVTVAPDGTVTQGPHPLGVELKGGYTVLELPSREDALEWATKIAAACRCPQEVREFQYDPVS